MNKQLTYYFLLFLIFCGCMHNVFSQDLTNSKPQYISESIFKDNFFRNARNLIIYNPSSSIFWGEHGLAYERKIGIYFGLEVGASYSDINKSSWVGRKTDFFSDLELGRYRRMITFHISPRYYFAGKYANSGANWAFLFKQSRGQQVFEFEHRNQTFEKESNFTFTRSGISFGSQFPLYKRLVIRADTGFNILIMTGNVPEFNQYSTSLTPQESDFYYEKKSEVSGGVFYDFKLCYLF